MEEHGPVFDLKLDDDWRKDHTQVEVLLMCVGDNIGLWHGPDGTPYAEVPVVDPRDRDPSARPHHENHPIRSRTFTSWLLQRYYTATQSTPNGNALRDAQRALEARAKFDGVEYRPWRRVARDEDTGTVYIDLGTPDWSAVAVDEYGWRVVESDIVPVHFIRTSHTGALPIPSADGGDVGLLSDLINVRDDDAFKLTLAWLIQALKPEGPYPVLDIQCEQGSAKTGTTKMLHAFVDPSTEPDPLRDRPRDEHSLAVAARTNWCLAYDNLSHINEWLSDALCRLSTGGAFGTRKFYSDDEETLLSAKRPVIMNSITGVITRPDLQDRAIVIEAPHIEDGDRRSEEDIGAAFAEAGPSIFAGLLDGLVAAMAAPTRRDKGGPRMVDFLRWATPALDHLGYPGLEEAYRNMRDDMNAIAVETDAVASALIRFMQGHDEWKGTSSELLNELAKVVADIFITRNKNAWPQSAKAFGWWLKRSSPVLRAVGLEVKDLPRVGAARKKSIKWLEGADRKVALAQAGAREDDDI